MHGCEFVGEEGLGGSVVVLAYEGCSSIHPIPKTNKSFSGEDARTQYSGLIHGFTLSTTTNSNEVCGSRQKTTQK